MKTTTLLLIYVLSGMASYAQNRSEDFVITLPEEKVQHSLYKTISYIDSRYDTSHMGIVQLGAFNKKAKVIPETHLSLQLNGVMNALTDATAGEGQLLFQLRQFSFAEITGATSEKGYGYLRAELYANDNNIFRKLASIDTVIYIKAMDVTRALFRNASKTLSGFIADHLKKPGQNTTYSYDDILHLDDLEKKSIPVYNVDAFTDGIYYSFDSFKNQLPDKTGVVEMKKGKITLVTTGENGKQVKVSMKDVYAVVDKGQIFIATEYGYYAVQKKDNDFYFTGKAKVNARSGDVIAASIFFGIIGGLIASDANATFEMKIDHLNGGFIRLREVPATH
jgi:hypothetical protein